MRRRVVYGWRVANGYCVSKTPPDLPQLPRETYPSILIAEMALAKRRTDVVWSGPALAEKNRIDNAA